MTRESISITRRPRPCRAEVLDAMLPLFSQGGYNAVRFTPKGVPARAALDDAARTRGAAARREGARRLFSPQGVRRPITWRSSASRARCERRAVTSSPCVAEHHAVLHALDALREEGFEVTLLPVDARGPGRPGAFVAALRPDTVLASVMYVNNESARCSPSLNWRAAARQRGVLFHTDAVQAGAYLPLERARTWRGYAFACRS